MKASRQIALTPDLVARVHRAIDHYGPEPGLVYHADEDYDALVPARCRAVRVGASILSQTYYRYLVGKLKRAAS